MEDVDGLHCSKDEHFLYVSELFVYLKKYFNTLVGDTPHGLSRQMNKMLISFHEPDTPLNQVLYCSLGEGITNWWSLSCVNIGSALFLPSILITTARKYASIPRRTGVSLRLIFRLWLSAFRSSDRAGYRCLPFQTIVDGHGVFPCHVCR